MRAIYTFIFTLLFSFNLWSQSQVLGVSVGDTTTGGFKLHVENAEQYFKSMDLKAIYFSDEYGGSPGYFVFSMMDRNGDGIKSPVIGVYFKGQTKLSANEDYNDEAQAFDVSSGYSCTIDDNKNTAKMDAKAINGEAFTKVYDTDNAQNDAIMALNDHMSGFRIVDLATSEYFGRCKNGTLLDHDDWIYKTIITFEWTNKDDYTKGKKADIVHIDISPSGYGVFSFKKTKNGKISGAANLKQLYIDAGFIEATPKKK